MRGWVGEMAVVVSGQLVPYEETRKRRVEENKRRMEELGLFDFSNSFVKNQPMRRKSVRRKTLSPEEVATEARRSPRFAGKPVVEHEDVKIHKQRRGLSRSGLHARCGTVYRQLAGRRDVPESTRQAALDAAEVVYKALKNPGFVRGMLHSHTASGFWLGLPVSFCREYLPHRDETIVLEDEKLLEWECVYLAKKIGLSGGWRGFSIDHSLVDGDACVFELVEPKRFKIHIFRCDNCEGSEVEDGSVGGNVSDSDALPKNKVSEDGDNNSPVAATSSEPRPRKLDEEYGEETDASTEACKSLKREAGADVAHSLRSSKHRRVKEENNDSTYSIATRSTRSKRKNDDNANGIVVEIVGACADEDYVKDARKPAAQNKTHQTEILSFGRITRNSTARSLKK